MDDETNDTDATDRDARDSVAKPDVKVFETSEVDVIPVIKSLLQSAEIPFRTEGEAMMNLYPSDLLGPIMGNPAGEVRFLVPDAQAEAARQLLTAEPLPTPELDGTASADDTASANGTQSADDTDSA
ncbi:MAG: DUF2007 domain-containing protein [Acidobacteriota bacterium]